MVIVDVLVYKCLQNSSVLVILGTISSFTGFVTRKTRRVSLVEQELHIRPEYLSSPPVFSVVRIARSLVFCAMFCRSLSFCPFFFRLLCCLSFFLLPIVLSVLFSVAYCVVCPFFSCLLCCLSFFLLPIVLSVLFSLAYCVVCPFFL